MSVITNKEEFLKNNVVSDEFRALMDRADAEHAALVKHSLVPGQLAVKQNKNMPTLAVSELTPGGGAHISPDSRYLMVKNQVMLYVGSCPGVPGPWAIVVIGDGKYHVQADELKPL